ncbi:MAG: anti-sigma factor [Phormidesmis sp.]
MIRLMPSETDQNLIAGYILGDLSPEEGRALKQRLLVEPALSDEMTALQAVLETAYGAESTPPAHLKDNILAAAANRPTPLWAVPQPHPNLPQAPLPQSSARREGRGEEREEAGAEETRSRRARTRQAAPRWLPYGFGAAAAVLMFALGVQNYTLRQSVQALQADLATELASRAGPEAMLTFALDAPENAPVIDEQTGEVTITVDPAQLEAVLNAQGLQPLPEEKVYALWAVVREGAFVTTDAKNAVLIATFNVDEGGKQTQAVAVPSVFQDIADVKAIAITVESAIAPQQHQSSPILIHQL